jgi:hypothetical protein
VSSVLASLLSEKSPSNGQYVRQRAVYGHVINLMVAGACVKERTRGDSSGWQQAASSEMQVMLLCLLALLSDAVVSLLPC